jgi:hypothetical protein
VPEVYPNSRLPFPTTPTCTADPGSWDQATRTRRRQSMWRRARGSLESEAANAFELGLRLCRRPLAQLRRSRLRREPRIGDLETALYTRHVIGVPRGILMERNRMTLDFPSTSRRASQNTNVRLASVTGLEETAVIVDSTKPPAPSRAGGPGVSCGPGNGTTVTAESDGTLGYWPERPTAGRCRWPGRQLGLSCRAPPLLNWCGRR